MSEGEAFEVSLLEDECVLDVGKEYKMDVFFKFYLF